MEHGRKAYRLSAYYRDDIFTCNAVRYSLVNSTLALFSFHSAGQVQYNRSFLNVLQTTICAQPEQSNVLWEVTSYFLAYK